MFFNKKYNDTNISITLKYLLSYLLNNIDKLSLELSKSYPAENARTLIYYCALNTIDEFYYTNKQSVSTLLSGKRIIELFKENYMIKEFKRTKLDIKYSQNVKNVISFFSKLEYELDSKDKEQIMKNVNKMIASAT
jgi:hypothetical protein